MLFKKIFWFTTLLIFILIWFFLFLYHKIQISQVQNETKISAQNGIDTLQKITLGHFDQWILIRGEDKTNPVLLFLHGGPGALLFTYARDIGIRAKLEQKFVMVYWEQRGSGKSYHPTLPDESMSIEQLVADTQELTRFLSIRFKQRKIYLVARSFGTLIGIVTITRSPELYHAYVAIGQMVYPLYNDSTAYCVTLQMAEKYGHEQATNELKEIGFPPYDYKNILIQRKWLSKFSEMTLGKKFNQQHPSPRTRLLSTPEYSLWDILWIGYDPYYSLRHLWNKKLYTINLMKLINNVDVAVYFLCGRHDFFSNNHMIQAFYEQLNAPKGKRLIWFENSGHEPERDEPDKFYEIMTEQVLSNN